MDAGVLQKDLAFGPKLLVAEHGPADGKGVGGQGLSAAARQHRAGEAEPAADPCSWQAELAVGVKGFIADHVASDHQPVGDQGRLAAPC